MNPKAIATTTIRLKGPSGRHHVFECSEVIDGIAIDPVLPKRFDDTPNEKRPDRHMAWWDVPYVVTGFVHRGPARYDVRCLDGGAWDRSTNRASFPNLESAVEAAKARTWKPLVAEAPKEKLHAFMAYQSTYSAHIVVKPHDMEQVIELCESKSVVWLLRHFEARSWDHAVSEAARLKAAGHGERTWGGMDNAEQPQEAA